MQISSVNYTPALAPCSAVSAPPSEAKLPAEEALSADSVSLGSQDSDSLSLQSSSQPPADSEKQVIKALDDMFANIGSGSDISPAGIASESAQAAVLSPEERSVGGFYLADGSLAVGEGITCALEGTEAVPTRGDVADYQLISHDAAVSDYNENVKSHLGPLERTAIKAYCTIGYKLMNGYMLGLNGSPTGVVRMACRCMTKALQRFDVPSGSVLYRTANINELRNYVTPEDFTKYQKIDESGQTEKLAKLLDARLTGTETHRKSFISTTIDDKFNFEDKPKVATRMYVGENVKGVYVAADSRLSPLPEEKEFLLAPDTKVTVLGVDYDPKNKGMVMHVLLGDLPQGSQG
ncbi:MAG: ADP-ribosyltransferase [bacterium]|nr:ADP-ribosyltransferase [bacterium]